MLNPMYDTSIMNLCTVYSAYIDINYHECMFFVCEKLYINVYIQTGTPPHKTEFYQI